MTQAIAPKTALYDRDYLQWVEDIVNKLRARDFEHLDIENLIEEIEDLGKSEKKEILNRLTTLLEHLLKRLYVDMPEEFNGWERTIREQRRQIKRAIEFSPSLAPLFCQFFDKAFDDALDEVRKEKGYKSFQFPDTWQFSQDLDAMLNIDFWG
ncbi:MAG: DUF29 domain-containing protein [Pseudanabaena sp. CRU_2_10]|nr:DUF29 domain-containing protein [Pseudanabaena sp. CRU_2_10]